MAALKMDVDHTMQDREIDLIRDELVKALRLAEQGKHRQAIDVCKRCLKNAEQRAVPLPEGFVGALLTRTGLSMTALGEIDDALYHYRLAEGILMRDKQKIREVRTQFHIALYNTDDDLRLLLTDIYQAFGQVYGIREEWDLSVDYFKRAFKIAQATENIDLAWRALNAMASEQQTRSLWHELCSHAERMLQLNALDPQPGREIVARRYLAQAYGRTGHLEEMLAELERIVSIGRETSYADLASDERALARAQQMLQHHEAESLKPVSIISVDTNQADVNALVSVPAPAESSAPAVVHSNPTPPEATDCPPDLIQAIHIETAIEHGAQEAIFVLQTRHLERAETLLNLFRLSPLAISIPGMLLLGDETLMLPRGGQIFVEWSLHDPLPNVLLDRLVIPNDRHDILEYANRETHRLSIFLESKEGGPFGKRRRVPLPGLFDPYVLDWRGITGVVRFLRRRFVQDNAGLSEQEAHHLLTLLEAPIKDGLPATGIYQEMGLIHRLVGDYEQALQCLRHEILFNMDAQGVPSIHVSQAFRHMGLIYQEQEEIDKARVAFAAGLAVNPNSFESLTAMAGTLDDPTDVMRYLGRAYRIRKQDSSWERVIESAAARHDRTTQQVEQAVAIIATQVDLSSRYDLDRISLRQLGLD